MDLNDSGLDSLVPDAAVPTYLPVGHVERLADEYRFFVDRERHINYSLDLGVLIDLTREPGSEAELVSRFARAGLDRDDLAAALETRLMVRVEPGRPHSQIKALAPYSIIDTFEFNGTHYTQGGIVTSLFNGTQMWVTGEFLLYVIADRQGSGADTFATDEVNSRIVLSQLPEFILGKQGFLGWRV